MHSFLSQSLMFFRQLCVCQLPQFNLFIICSPLPPSLPSSFPPPLRSEVADCRFLHESFATTSVTGTFSFSTEVWMIQISEDCDMLSERAAINQQAAEDWGRKSGAGKDLEYLHHLNLLVYFGEIAVAVRDRNIYSKCGGMDHDHKQSPCP